MILWRISEFASLDGEGGKLYPGRWHSGGQAVSYASDHPASSLCEMLVHLDMNFLPVSFQFLKISAELSTIHEAKDLQADWTRDVETTRSIGDKWLNSNASALMRVPSAIVPEAYNILINPAHPDMSKVRIDRIIKFPLDPRLF
jgi:RES domain-containing protein